MALDDVVKRLAGAGLDLTPALLLDAIWLASQPGLRLVDAVPAATIPAPPAIDEPLAERKTHEKSPAPSTHSDAGGQAQTVPAAVPVFSGPAPSSETTKASPIRIPAGAALPGKLALARALRPFRLRRPSPQALELDEERTVDLTADRGGDLQLMFRPRSERWYEAIVIVEDAPSMDVWHETIAELVAMLRDTGAFRNVSTRTLSFVAVKQAGRPDRIEPMLSSGPDARVTAESLASERVRRIIFFATHGVSQRWRDASLAGLIQRWAKTASVVILHLLPTQLWRQTSLGEPRGQVRAGEAGVPTAQLQIERFEWDLSLSEDESVVAVPVIPLEPTACFKWAQMQMARGKPSAAMLIPTTPPTSTPAGAADIGAPPSVAEQVALFRSYGSALAFRLAVYLAAGPFTLPVARLIQTARFGSAAQQSHLAEVLLSGLFYRVTPTDRPVAPDWVQYDVLEGAREILLRSLREEDAQHIASVLEQHVNRYIAETYGKPADFRALVRDEHGQFELPDWAQPFATIGEAILKLQGNASIDPRPQLSPRPPSPEPPQPAVDVATDRRYWVLGVGSSGVMIADELRAFAQSVGRLLAERDYCLVVGGWDGVDLELTQGFADVARARGWNLDERLVQVIAPGDEPQSSVGRMLLCETDQQYEAETLGRSDVVVLIGGHRYTQKAGRRAIAIGVPVVPVAATGGSAAELFDQLRRSEFPTYPKLVETGPNLALDTLQAIESALRPDSATLLAARAYLQASDVGLADLIDRRMTARGPAFLQAGADSGEGLEHDALRAWVQRLAPTSDGIAAIVETLRRPRDFHNPSLNLIWLRLLAVQAGFAHTAVRGSLSPDLPSVFSSLYNRLDDETGHGNMPGRLKTALAGPLRRLARLIRTAETARSPSTSADAVTRPGRDVLDDAATSNCLQDLDPGWRAVGLGRQIADPAIALLTETLGATRFESTYESHLDLCLEALSRMAQTAHASEVSAEDRHALEQFIRGRPDSSAVNVITAWLKGVSSIEEDEAAQARKSIDEWTELVAAYGEIRATMPPSPERAIKMTAVVTKMKAVVRATRAEKMRTTSRRWVHDRERGWRLAGYVVAHEIGGEADIKPLCDSLMKYRTPQRRPKDSPDNKPFGDYWGLLALLQVVNRIPSLGRSQSAMILKLEGIAPPGTDRGRTWSEIEAKVKSVARTAGQKQPPQAAPSKSAKAQAAPPMVFINYRQEDTAWVARMLAIALVQRLGDDAVFMNIDQLQAGEAWPRNVQAAVERCTVFVCLIGKAWLSAHDAMGQRRLHRPDDWVRLEIELALMNERVILPVLVDGAQMPPAWDLPPSLDISRWNAVQLRAQGWDADVERIVSMLQMRGFHPKAPPSPAKTRSIKRQAPATKKAAPRRSSSPPARRVIKKASKQKTSRRKK